MSIHTDPETGKHYAIFTTDAYGRVRDTDGLAHSMSLMEEDLGYLADALQDIAAFVVFTRRSKQDVYRELSVNSVPESVLEAMQRAGRIQQEMEALDLWRRSEEKGIDESLASILGDKEDTD